MSNVSCENCIAACCMAKTCMPLTDSEVAFMTASGNLLKEVLPAIPGVDWDATVEAEEAKSDPFLQRVKPFAEGLPESYGLYILGRDCANLVERDGWRQCSVYDDPERPRICQQFPVGSEGCLAIRLRRKVDKGNKALVRLASMLPPLVIETA